MDEFAIKIYIETNISIVYADPDAHSYSVTIQ